MTDALLKYIYLFLTVLGLRCCAGCSVQPQCTGFSLQWPRLPRRTGSRVCELHELCAGSVAAALEYRFSSCGAQAQLPYGMWDLPRPGVESVSPALAGRPVTTEPPGKP